MRFLLVTLLATVSVSSLAGFVLADNEPSIEDTYPVVAQLQLRDRTVTITSAPAGYQYTIADESGAVLSAELTEDQLAEQYPELVDMLRPAVAGEGSGLMMLAPIKN